MHDVDGKSQWVKLPKAEQRRGRLAGWLSGGLSVPAWLTEASLFTAPVFRPSRSTQSLSLSHWRRAGPSEAAGSDSRPPAGPHVPSRKTVTECPTRGQLPSAASSTGRGPQRTEQRAWTLHRRGLWYRSTTVEHNSRNRLSTEPSTVSFGKERRLNYIYISIYI